MKLPQVGADFTTGCCGFEKRKLSASCGLSENIQDEQN